MWESKDNALDATYNAYHIWFDEIGGQHTQKPADIRKWEDSKVYKLIENKFPKVKADKMLSDLSSIALEWAKSYVRQRQTFKLNTKGENMAPLAFQSDSEGIYHDLAVQLRNTTIGIPEEHESGMPIPSWNLWTKKRALLNARARPKRPEALKPPLSHRRPPHALKR